MKSTTQARPKIGRASGVRSAWTEAMDKRAIGKRCACDNPAFTVRNNQYICKRCWELEHAEWLHNTTCGFPEPDAGEPMDIHMVADIDQKPHKNHHH